LGSDIIVGFPGETDSAFERALEFFAALPLTYFHVFPYSVRRGTAAAGMSDHVPAPNKKERARRMRELGRRKKDQFCRQFVGRRLAVLVEETREKKTGYARGFSRNYLPVIARDLGNVSNREVWVSVDRFDGDWLSGALAPDGAAAVYGARERAHDPLVWR
jgi:threonylcarbamoyladenosine tRNA methylthiotransferase MtaB